jgi:hypothetical protein
MIWEAFLFGFIVAIVAAIIQLIIRALFIKWED